MADDDPIQQLAVTPPAVKNQQDLHSFIYNTLIPEYLKDQPGNPMPPEGTPPGKFGPPSGPMTGPEVAGSGLMDALSYLGGPAAKGAGAAVTKGIFAGPMAKTANLTARNMAEKLEHAGATAEHIFDNTGWFRGKDGNWRHEISDAGMQVKQLPKAGPNSAVEGVLQHFISHPDLFKAYPELAGLKTKVNPMLGPENVASTWGSGPSTWIELGGSVNQRGLTAEQQASLIHEIQHPVQEKEGFAPGGNPDWVYNAVYDNLQSKKNQNKFGSKQDKDKVSEVLNWYLQPNLSYEMYKRLPGETEARNASDRFVYDKFGVSRNEIQKQIPHELKKYPWRTEDVPRDKQFDYLQRALGK